MSNFLEEPSVLVLIENDENQPPQLPKTSSTDKLNCIGTLLKESHWNNIDLIPTMVKMGSSKQSPASSAISTPPEAPSEEDNISNNTNPNPQCLIDEENCKVVSQQNHEENNVTVANLIIPESIEPSPPQIDQCLKLDIQSNYSNLNSSGEKHDSHSICSADYTPSDSSFDTAREDLQHSLPETEYESANDFDDSTFSFSASSPRDGSTIPESVFLKNLQTVIPNRHKVLSDPEISIVEWNDVIKEEFLVPFDRESTPIVLNELNPIESPIEFIAVDSNDNICGTVAVENIICTNIIDDAKTQTEIHSTVDENVFIDPASILNELHLSEELPLNEQSQIESSESLTVRDRLNSDPCSDISGETVVETGINPQIEHCEPDLQPENGSEISTKLSGSEEVDQQQFVIETKSIQLELCEEKNHFPDVDIVVDKSEDNTQSEIQVESQFALIEDNNTINRDQQVEKVLISIEQSSGNNNEEEFGEKLDTDFGTIYWKSNYNNCQIAGDKLIVAREDSVDGSINHDEPVKETVIKEEFAEVELDLDERLKLEAAIVAEELINSSLRENTETDENKTEHKSMKDNKMADTENNETTHDASVESVGKMDENVNPFQSKSKIGSSPPVRRGSGKMKNGEVSTPKLNLSTHDSPLKKSASAPKPVRTAPIASPKRKGSETTPIQYETSPIVKTQVDSHGGDVEVDVDGFKKPMAKQPTSARSSSSKILQAESEAGDAGMMVRSVEDNLISEAGPDVAEFSDSEFRSAAEVFKDPAAFDFLQMAGSKHLSESALARMSLYVKFDPLLKAISPVAKRTLSKTSTSDQSQMSDTSEDLLLLGTPTNKENPDKPQEANGTAMNRNACMEARLLDLSPSPLKHQLKATECSSPQSGHRFYSEEEFIQALRMQELLFQEQLLKKDREADEKAKLFEKEMHDGANRLIVLQNNCDEMKKTVLEYEKTISQLIDDRETEKKITEGNVSSLGKERDQALEDLQGVEKAFGDLHRRFEKSKAAVEGFKKNEEILTNCVKEGQIALKKQEQKYGLLKQHAEETLSCANQEIDALRRTSEVEIAALRAQLKKAEMKVESLEKNLQQMHKENSELTNICDELIAKVGMSNA